MKLKLEALVQEIKRIFPLARVDFDYFSSGTASVGVALEGRFFVLDYFPKEGFGVSEVLDGEGWLHGHEHSFANLEDAKCYFVSLIATAEKVPAERPLAVA